MRYSFEEIKEAPNYLKIGNTEAIVKIDDDNKDTIRERYKKIIEPWLSAALQTEHLAMLVGAGLTIGTCEIAKVKASSMHNVKFGDDFDKKINDYAKVTAQKMGRGEANIEDQLRVAMALFNGYAIDGNESSVKLGDKINDTLSLFCKSILSSETNLLNALNSEVLDEQNCAKKAMTLLQSFLFTFACRNATRDRTHIFTTNYDRLIEYGCDVAGIKVIDRFCGKIEPRFQDGPMNIDYYYHTPDIKNEFRYAEGVVRYTKLHGSIDWFERDGIICKDSIRFGQSDMNIPDGANYKDNIMVYPNSMKAVETAFYPYSELFRDFSTSICRPNTTLFTYGYGFGDTHINKIISEMMSTPSTHLIIVTHSVDERLISFLAHINMAQISILAGEEFCKLESLVSYYLPKAAIDTITEKASHLVEIRKGYSNIEDGDEDNDRNF